MTKQERIGTLEMAKAEVEWEYPLDYYVALDETIKELKHMSSTGIFLDP